MTAWKHQQIQLVKTKNDVAEAERKKKFKSVLNTEIEMLQTLDRQFLVTSKQQSRNKTNEFLKTISSPKLWLNSDKRVNQVTTAHTIRAKELYDVYTKLQDDVICVVCSLGRQI